MEGSALGSVGSHRPVPSLRIADRVGSISQISEELAHRCVAAKQAFGSSRPEKTPDQPPCPMGIFGDLNKIESDLAVIADFLDSI